MQHHTINCKLYWKLIVFVKSALLYYLRLFAGSHIDIKSAFGSLLDIMSTGGRWEGGSGWGTHVHPWQIHVNVWQNQYNIVK